MRVFGNRVLVRQTMKKKKSSIIVPEGAKASPDQFEVTQKVTMLGDGYEGTLKVGDVPIFSNYANLGNTKVIEKKEDSIITDIIVHAEDIIGADDDEFTGLVERGQSGIEEK